MDPHNICLLNSHVWWKMWLFDPCPGMQHIIINNNNKAGTAGQWQITYKYMGRIQPKNATWKNKKNCFKCAKNYTKIVLHN